MFQPGSTYKFDLPRHHKSIIKVIGVGGGGSNAVNHMFRLGIKDVEFVVCNTDLQALNASPVPTKLQIGTNLTEGLGCGANPEVGQAAAIESKEQIREALSGAKMVFITAGMGGGTGTGAAPVIARIAKEMDILTVGIVTMPFEFEGKKKIAQARKGLEGMRTGCDTVLAIMNDKLRQMFGNLAISQAFGEADGVLTTAAKGIAEIITLAGYVNVDFQDVRTVMLNAGAAVMGSAETSGEDRSLRAAQQALASPLLDNKDIMGAKKILLSIISGEEAELQMDELSQITGYIQEQAGDKCEVIFGHGVDANLGHCIRVTVIATGFADGRARARREAKKILDLEKNELAAEETDNSVNERNQEIELKVSDEMDFTDPVREEIFFDVPEEKPLPEVMEELHQETSPEKAPEEIQELKEEELVPVLRNPKEEKPEITEEPPAEERVRTWTLFDQEEVKAKKPEEKHEEEPEEVSKLEEENEFELGKEVSADQVINEEGMMEVRKTKQRLEQQAKERREKLKGTRKQEMSKEEFNEKWALPAYMRRGVKMENVPHSSERFISKYNLNDENNLLGNNKFLHDNVD